MRQKRQHTAGKISVDARRLRKILHRKAGNVYHVFPELYKIRQYLGDPNLSFAFPQAVKIPVLYLYDPLSIINIRDITFNRHFCLSSD